MENSRHSVRTGNMLSRIHPINAPSAIKPMFLKRLNPKPVWQRWPWPENPMCQTERKEFHGKSYEILFPLF